MPYGQASPEDVLNQLLEGSAPQYYGGGVSRPSTEAENIFADRPAEEAIRHYVTTGQMPTQLQTPPHGLIEHIGTALGLRPSVQPVTQAIRDRAVQAKRGYDEAEIARRLGEMQAIAPQVVQFGGEFGRQAMKAVGEPGLAAAYPTGAEGKGEVQMRGQELKAQQAAAALSEKTQRDEEMARIQELRMQGQQAAAATRANELLLKIQQEGQKLDLERWRYETNPINKVATDRLDRISGERKAVWQTMGTALPGTDMTRFTDQLKKLDDEERTIQMNMGTARSVGELFRPIAGEAAPAAPATKATGRKPLPKGIFGGGEPVRAKPAARADRAPAPAATPGSFVPAGRAEDTGGMLPMPAAAATSAAPVARPYPRTPFER